MFYVITNTSGSLHIFCKLFSYLISQLIQVKLPCGIVLSLVNSHLGDPYCKFPSQSNSKLLQPHLDRTSLSNHQISAVQVVVYVLFEGLTNVILLVKTSDMASLLREQTRIKESLEGALERQREGMHMLSIKKL